MIQLSFEQLCSGLEKGEGYLIISPANRKYLTDFDSSDGCLLITQSKSVFLTDSRYIEAARDRIKLCDEVLLLKKASEQLPGLIKELGVSVVYTEESNISVADFRRVEKYAGCKVRAEKAEDAVNALRRVKQEYEKERIIKAQRIAEAAFRHILGFIKPGVTETDIRLELEFYMLKHGAQGLSFDTIAVTGRKTSMPHGVPGGEKVKNGDFVTMDYGALVDGYHSDMTRTVAVGSVSDRQAKVYETVLEAQLSSLAVYAPGVSCKEADGAARSVIEKAGYGDYFGHGTGHGVGVEIHEAPAVSPRSAETLCPGDVVTCEPGIYIPGEFGVRIEDMVYINSTGSDNLTECEKSLIVL